MKIQNIDKPLEIFSLTINEPLLCRSFEDSICFGKCACSLSQCMGWLKGVFRRIRTFFHSILSYCFPVFRQAMIRKEDITYKKQVSKKADGDVFQIFIHGKETKSEIRYFKEDKGLVIKYFSFDERIKELRAWIFSELLKQEAIDGLIPIHLGQARDLWKMGYRTEETIFFDPKEKEMDSGIDSTYQYVKKVIEKIHQKKGLEGTIILTLKRIEENISQHSTNTTLGKFFNLNTSCFNESSKIGISLSDLLLLMEVLDKEEESIRDLHSKPLYFNEDDLPIFKKEIISATNLEELSNFQS